MHMNIKHFIFDLDGTLWNTTEISAIAYNRALRKEGHCRLHVTPEVIKKEFGKPLDAIADDLFPDCGQTGKTRLMDACDRSNTTYLKETDTDLLYPDVRDTMARLARHCRLYIVSNCQRGYIEMFLEKYGLGSYITDTECFGNNGKSKAENIRLLMERNGIEEAVYVGDTAGDYESATRAGIPFIFASYGYGTIRQSSHTIISFSELLDYIAS